MFTCMASCDLLGKRVRKALPTLHKRYVMYRWSFIRCYFRRSLGVEFSDDSPLHDHYYNQSDVEKENQPHPPAANQLPPLSAELSKSPHFNDCAVDQPHPSSTTAAEQPHPSFTHSRYYKLIKDHISRNKDGCGSVSHDAWTLTCEFFNSRPPVTTSDWSEFNLCCINKN